MKTIIVCCLLTVVLPFQNCLAQFVKKKVYIAHIEQVDGTKIKGILYRINETDVELAQVIRRSVDTVFHRILSSEIKNIRVRKKGTIRTGFIVGAIVGSFIGYEVGYSSVECGSAVFCFPELAGINGAIVGSLVGGLAGVAVGGIQKKFIVQGNQQLFDLHKVKLKGWTIRH